MSVNNDQVEALKTFQKVLTNEKVLNHVSETLNLAHNQLDPDIFSDAEEIIPEISKQGLIKMTESRVKFIKSTDIFRMIPSNTPDKEVLEFLRCLSSCPLEMITILSKIHGNYNSLILQFYESFIKKTDRNKRFIEIKDQLNELIKGSECRYPESEMWDLIKVSKDEEKPIELPSDYDKLLSLKVKVRVSEEISQDKEIKTLIKSTGYEMYQSLKRFFKRSMLNRYDRENGNTATAILYLCLQSQLVPRVKIGPTTTKYILRRIKYLIK